GSACGAGRSWPPRAADPARLCRPQGADDPQGVGQGDLERAGPDGSGRAAGESVRHLLGIADLSADEITKILDLAETFVEISERPIKKVPTLRGKTVINLFLE